MPDVYKRQVQEEEMNFNRGKMAAAAVLAATLLVVGGVDVYKRQL